jgi:hypothetical protein
MSAGSHMIVVKPNGFWWLVVADRFKIEDVSRFVGNTALSSASETSVHSIALASNLRMWFSREIGDPEVVGHFNACGTAVRSAHIVDRARGYSVNYEAISDIQGDILFTGNFTAGKSDLEAVDHATAARIYAFCKLVCDELSTKVSL